MENQSRKEFMERIAIPALRDSKPSAEFMQAVQKFASDETTRIMEENMERNISRSEEKIARGKKNIDNIGRTYFIIRH